MRGGWCKKTMESDCPNIASKFDIYPWLHKYLPKHHFGCGPNVAESFSSSMVSFQYEGNNFLRLIFSFHYYQVFLVFFSI